MMHVRKAANTVDASNAINSYLLWKGMPEILLAGIISHLCISSRRAPKLEFKVKRQYIRQSPQVVACTFFHWRFHKEILLKWMHKVSVITGSICISETILSYKIDSIKYEFLAGILLYQNSKVFIHRMVKPPEKSPLQPVHTLAFPCLQQRNGKWCNAKRQTAELCCIDDHRYFECLE